MVVDDSKIEGFVLSMVKYGDNGRIVRILSKQNGLMACMVHSLHSKKSGAMRPSMVMPMTQLDMVINNRSKGQLKSFKEVRILRHWQTLHSDPIKMTLCTFCAEVLQRIVTEGFPDEGIYNAVEQWLISLDDLEGMMSTSAHELLLIVCRHVGCFPRISTYCEGFVFDMIDGHFIENIPSHNHWLNPEESSALIQLINRGKPSKEIRNVLLDSLLQYLRIHHEPFGTIKSLDVIREVLY